MKRKIWIAGMALILVGAIVVCGYCDLRKDPLPLYIPGRDTLQYWNDGICDIVGTLGFNSLRINRQAVTAHDDFVAAYKQVGNVLFFITEKSRIIVDLETAAYTAYEGTDPADAEHAAVFSDQDSFTWLSVCG